MKVAVGSDMKTHLTDVVIKELNKMGHDVEVFGALVKEPAMWSKVAVEVAEKVSAENMIRRFYFAGQVPV